MRLDILHKRGSYSALSLLLVIIAEIIIICQLKNDSVEFFIPLIIVGAIIILGLTGWLVGKYKFWPQSTIFTNLMANAITPSWLGAFYLVLFIVHLGWLSDGTLNLFTSDFLDTSNVLVSIYTSIIGLIILICFFPDVKPDKSDAKKYVLVAGMSKLNIDKTTRIISVYNQIPLVSFLNLAFKDGSISPSSINKILILNTNAHYEADYFKDAAIDISSCVKTNNNQIPSFIDASNIKDIVEGENHQYLYYLDNQKKNSVKDILRTIIKIIALQLFPNQNVFVERLQIDFTDPCDYDDFEQCFQILDNAIKKEDNNNQLLYFNLTPGTGIVGSLMTLFSIDKDRQLFFYSQNSSKELLPVDKSRLPLENLLSQALEKIKELK